LDARVTSIDRKDRKVSLSVKAHDAAEEKQAMAEYGSSDSGASLGDILGAALNRANEERDATDEPEEIVEETDEVPEEAAGDGDDAAGEEDKTDK
jgi:small subunit ribosomal protein S1